MTFEVSQWKQVCSMEPSNCAKCICCGRLGTEAAQLILNLIKLANWSHRSAKLGYQDLYCIIRKQEANNISQESSRKKPMHVPFKNEKTKPGRRILHGSLSFSTQYIVRNKIIDTQQKKKSIRHCTLRRHIDCHRTNGMKISWCFLIYVHE